MIAKFEKHELNRGTFNSGFCTGRGNSTHVATMTEKEYQVSGVALKFGTTKAIVSVCVCQDQLEIWKLNRRMQKAVYDAKPEVKAKKAAYRAKPEVKAKQAAYNAKPEVKAKQAAYNAKPAARAKQLAHQRKPAARAKQLARQRAKNCIGFPCIFKKHGRKLSVSGIRSELGKLHVVPCGNKDAMHRQYEDAL